MELISFKKKYLETLKVRTPSRWKVKGFAMLPNSLLFADNIGKAELLVFWVLTMHLFRGKEYTMPSVRQIQQEAKISRPTVIAAIQSLEKLGYLEAERTKGRRTKYYLKIKI